MHYTLLSPLSIALLYALKYQQFYHLDNSTIEIPKLVVKQGLSGGKCIIHSRKFGFIPFSLNSNWEENKIAHVFSRLQQSDYTMALQLTQKRCVPAEEQLSARRPERALSYERTFRSLQRPSAWHTGLTCGLT